MFNQAIYIHVPWCRRRCPYCDFYFVVGKPEQSYISSLLVEFDHRAPQWLKKPADTLYFGGGTPSMLRPEEVASLIAALRDRQALAPQAEITLEANPEDLDQAALSSLKNAGVNRLSLGVQSFDDDILQYLGRVHRRGQAETVIKVAQAVGFDNISIDLIIGVNGERWPAIEDSVHRLAEQGIPHISAYLLTVEDGTNFARRIKKGQINAPREEEQVQSYRALQSLLKSLGYVQYDISSYAKPGFKSRHNQVYWSQGSYLGLGPGAHSMRLRSDGGTERAHNKPDVKAWLSDPCIKPGASEVLPPPDALREALAFGLRNLDDGIDVKAMAARHGCQAPAGLAAAIKKSCEKAWLEENGDIVRITAEGALFADWVMAEILSC